MTLSRTIVLVARSDPDRVDRLAERLREHWAVRTAYDADAAVETAADDPNVAVIDDGLPGVEDRLLPALHDAHGCRVVLMTDDPSRVAVRTVDRSLARTAETEDVLAAVREVRLRARYHELVEHYYELAVERSTLLSKDGNELADARAEEIARLLDGLRPEIDEVIETLSERDAFARLCRELPPGDECDVGDLEAGV